jgi:hypothetical protein
VQQVQSLRTNSKVLALPQAYRTGIHVAAATVDAEAGTITIRLNKYVATATPVAYFVLD